MRMHAVYALSDREWEVLRPLMPEPTGRRHTDWRAAAGWWCVRFAAFGGRGAKWRNIPHGSTWRMALQRAEDAGVFTAIERALPRLPLNVDVWRHVIAGARRYGR